MTINVISQIQHRRGIKTDLPPQLAEGELGFCLDTRQLFIGNSGGFGDNTEILTEYSQGTMPFFGATTSTISAGSTVYLGPNGVDGASSSTNSGFLMPVDGIIQSLNVKTNNSPGAALAYTYTIYQNGNTTAMTGNIIGTNANSLIISHDLYVNQGDVLSLQIVTDALTTPSQHIYSFVLQH